MENTKKVIKKKANQIEKIEMKWEKKKLYSIFKMVVITYLGIPLVPQDSFFFFFELFFL